MAFRELTMIDVRELVLLSICERCMTPPLPVRAPVDEMATVARGAPGGHAVLRGRSIPR
jgi:hypothetical protein